MQSSYRKTLIRVITFIGGLYFFLEFVLPTRTLEQIGVAQYHEKISYGFITFGIMAVGLGLINLFMVHGSKIAFWRKNWQYSLVLLVGLLVMMTITTADWLAGLKVSRQAREVSILADFSKKIASDVESNALEMPPFAVRNQKLVEALKLVLAKIKQEVQEPFQLENETAQKLADSYKEELGRALKVTEALMGVIPVVSTKDYNTDANNALATKITQLGAARRKLLQHRHEHAFVKKLFNLFYHGLFVALGSSMFSLLGVYIAAAAYRAFRVKTLESTLMMAAAVIVILGQIPFDFPFAESFTSLRLWLLEKPSSAAFRAIAIGAAIAGLIMAFRMWFSIESESFSKKEQ